MTEKNRNPYTDSIGSSADSPRTKTFKGFVDVDSRRNGWAVETWSDEHLSDPGNEWFPNDEWDMEVTFTKKAKPVEAGQWCEHGPEGQEELVFVLAVHGKMAWVTDDPDDVAVGHGGAWTETLDKLR